ncbi:MAG: ADP-ribosylglycohydrolase family protein [Cyanobacteria bacterium J06635_1]
MNLGLRDRFRSALVGTYLAEFRFGASSKARLNLSALTRQAIPPKLQAHDPADQLVELVPWLLQTYGQNYSPPDPQNKASVIGCMAGETQQMVKLLAWSLEHLLDHRPSQTLLASLSQRLPPDSPGATQAKSMVALLDKELKRGPQGIEYSPIAPLRMVQFQVPELLPIGVALYSFLRVPESYGLAVKYAFNRTHSSAIAALTGLLAGAKGGVSQMPIPWLIAWLTAVGASSGLTKLDLIQGEGLADLWSRLDAPFYQWMGSPITPMTREVPAQPPVRPLPSI